MKKVWTAADIPSQAGKRVVITGGNSGIGWEAALELARAGAEVALAARSEAKALDAIERIHREAPSARLRAGVLDLACFDSIRAFASTQHEPIDLLINNAGIMNLPTRQLTADGLEAQFGTNVVGHFLLTGLLLPHVLKVDAPRVVNVSSSAHQSGKIDFDNLNAEKSYSGWRAYAQSKLANILFTRELQHRSGSRLMTNSCHPGYARTNLQGNSTAAFKALSILFLPLSQTAAKGALPTLFAATAPDAKPLGYYGPDGLFGLVGNVHEAKVTAAAQDDAVAARLFDRLEEMTGFQYSF